MLAMLRNIRNIRICKGKKHIVSITYEDERISITKKKNSLPYIKCVLRFFCVVHGPIFGRFLAVLWVVLQTVFSLVICREKTMDHTGGR